MCKATHKRYPSSLGATLRISWLRCHILQVKGSNHPVLSMKNFHKPNAIALSPILYNRVLLSHDGVGCSPLASHRATTIVSIHQLAHTLDCWCLWNTIMSKPSTINCIQDCGWSIQRAYWRHKLHGIRLCGLLWERTNPMLFLNTQQLSVLSL